MSFLKKLFGKKETRIVPRIKNVGFFNEAKKVIGSSRIDMPITQDLIGDLIIAYAIDDGGESYSMVTGRHMDDLKMTQTDLISQAYANGMMEMANAQIASDGNSYQIVVDNNMSACSILYPDFWNQVMDEVGGPIYAIFPHRDAAFYGPKNETTRKSFSDILNEGDQNDNHNLTKLLFSRSKKSEDAPLNFNKSWPHQIGHWEIVK